MVRATVLVGRCVSLMPLALEHEAGLSAAVRDGELWRLWYTLAPQPDGMRAEIERRLGLQAQGTMLPFTVADGAGEIVGMTTYMNVDAVNRRVEIGSTWYAADGVEYGGEAALAGTCVRDAGVHRGGVSDALDEPAEPAGDRTAWGEAGWRAAESFHSAEWDASGYVRV
jgi:hypothetical protein